LGNFRLLTHGQPVAVRSGGKTEALLTYVAMATRQGVPRETLLPESEVPLAANALNNLVHALRGRLSPALGGASPVVHTGGYYRLNQEAGLAVDVNLFKLLAAQSALHARQGDRSTAAALAERAVLLYGGDLRLAFSEASTAYAIFERDRLRATCLELLMRLADDAFERGDFEACQVYALRLLADDPCREDAHRVVMRCYVRLGERAQALRHYQTVQAVLRAEFDIEPEPATRELYEQIRLDPSAV
jgi:DNA-binding SARP family transcriptional activator